MGRSSNLLKNFFEKERRKYKEQFLKDICLSGRPIPKTPNPEERPSQMPAPPLQQTSAELTVSHPKDEDHINE